MSDEGEACHQRTDAPSCGPDAPHLLPTVIVGRQLTSYPLSFFLLFLSLPPSLACTRPYLFPLFCRTLAALKSLMNARTCESRFLLPSFVLSFNSHVMPSQSKRTGATWSCATVGKADTSLLLELHQPAWARGGEAMRRRLQSKRQGRRMRRGRGRRGRGGRSWA